MTSDILETLAVKGSQRDVTYQR